MAADRSTRLIGQRHVRRFGASLGLIALALLISRYVTPSGASSPLVLLGATAAIAYFGGRWPALLATATAVIVNGLGIGVDDVPRLAVESSMLVLLGSLLAFRIPVDDKESADINAPIVGEATVSRVNDTEIDLAMSSDASLKDKIGQATIPPPSDVDREPPKQRPAAPASPAETRPVEARSPTSLLVVHGNAVLRLALRSTLAGLGYQVRDVANVSHAASLLEAERFDGVVLEIGRADNAAFAAVERLRGIATSGGPKNCIVIVLASVDTDDDRELLLAAGADFVLRKPIDTAGVAAKVQEQLPIPDGRIQSRVGLGASP